MLLLVVTIFVTAHEIMPDKPEIMPPQYNFIDIELIPEKQIANVGEWVTYAIVVKDLHKEYYTHFEDESNMTEDLKVWKYKLEFSSSEDIEYDFSEEIIYMSAGQMKVIKLSVRSHNKGTHDFKVYVEGKNAWDVSYGKLVVIGDSIPTTRHFSGKGFATNGFDGELIDLSFTQRNNVLNGRISIGESQTYRINGESSGNKVTFNLFRNYRYPKDTPYEQEMDTHDIGNVIAQEEIFGKFVGKMTSYDDFVLLEGKLETVNGETFSITIVLNEEFREIVHAHDEATESEIIQN